MNSRNISNDFIIVAKLVTIIMKFLLYLFYLSIYVCDNNNIICGVK